MKLTLYEFLLFVLVLNSCETKDINFPYTKMADDGIIIKNYYPINEEQLIRYLSSVNDTLKYKSMFVYLEAENIQRLNPDFKQNFFRSSMGQRILKERSYDTALIMKNYSFSFGYLKGGKFKKEDLYDCALLKGKFLLIN
jgi:hypothetical protein